MPGGIDLAACGLHLAAQGRHMQHIAENVAYGAAWKAPGYHTGRYGTSVGMHLAAGGLHLAAQGLQNQHMAVHAAYGGWLAGHRGPTDLRQHAQLMEKWSCRDLNCKQHSCKQQYSSTATCNLEAT